MDADARADRAESDRDAPARHRPTLLLWVLAGLIVAALVVGGLAGALREPAPLAADTAEGVVQRYLQAVLDGDVEAARTHLSADTAGRCGSSDFRLAWVPESLTASLDEVRPLGDATEVRVRLRSVSGPGPFGGGGFASVETFALALEDGRWRLTGDPWPLIQCGPSR